MSYLSPGLLEAYNSLTDKHLIGYFNNTRIRRHLRRAGLITRSGRIVPEKEYRQKLIHRAHQRHVRECLAQAIFHKVLDMEREHQTEIKKRLEEFARRERVYKIKVERSKRHEDDFIPVLSPRPPTGPRGNHTQQSRPEGEMSESTESPGSSRPNTAPGKMQRPVRLKPIDRNSTTASIKRTPPCSRNQDSSNDTDQPLSLDRDMRHWAMQEYNSTVSPYRLPVINNYVTPVPPQTKRRERGMKGPLNGTRGRRLRPTTAPSIPANTEDSTLLRTSVQSKVTITMVYFGRSVHLSHELMDLGDEVKVFQQHCGGENLCVYKGRLRRGETFQFVSRRHRGFPFSLTFYLNGLQVDRLSSCCEFKHRKGSRLGGRHGHFGFFSVDGAQPCYKCIIAMGLDKKPTPPPKRVSDDTESSLAIELCPEPPQEPAEVQEDQEERKELETETDSTQPHNLKIEEEAMQDDQPKDDYEEDFEADDEGPVEDRGEDAGGKSPSPTNEGKMEDEIEDAPEGEPAEHNKHPEDEDKTDQKETRSVSSGSTSSCFGSDPEDNEDEAETKEDEIAAKTTKASEVIPLAEPETEPSIPMETLDKDQPVEDAEMMEVSSPVPTEAAATAEAAVEAHTEAQNSAGDSLDKAELEVSDSTEAEAPAAVTSEGMADPAGGSSAESKPERAKSVQEKLTEALLNEAHSSPEPELSDTSTEEEEEESSEKTPQETTAVEPETGVALSLLQPEKGQDKQCEEGSKEISNEETGAQASEERETLPENKENQATDEQDVVTEEPDVEYEKMVESEEKVEPMDESSMEALETPANPDSEKKEEMVSTEVDETPHKAETEAENKDQDTEENMKEQTEESSTIANETESASLEKKEEVVEEMKETKGSEAPLDQQEKEDEEKKDLSENKEETAEGEPAVSETEAQKTSEEPSESVMAVSEVAQSEEPYADDTKREEEISDEQDGVGESGAARADDATAHDATTHNDSSDDDKSTAQEPVSSVVKTLEKTSDTNILGKDNEENSDETFIGGKKVESDENTVNEIDRQNTDVKDEAEEEKPDNADEGTHEVKQGTENESAAMDKEGNFIDEQREDKDRPVENVETVQEQTKLDTGEQLEEEKTEEVAKEVHITDTEDKQAENEVKAVEEDLKTSISDGEKETSEEDKNATDKTADGDERNSVSEGEKVKSVEGEGNRNMYTREPEDQEAKAEMEDSIAETIAKDTEKEIEVDDCGQDGGNVKNEEVDKPINGQVDEREVEAEKTGKENEEEGEEEKKEIIQHEEDQLQCREKDNTGNRGGGDTKTVDDAEDSTPKHARSKVDDQVGETLEYDDANTKVEEAERSEKDTAEVIEKNDSETCDGERGNSGGREEEADNCGDADDARTDKREHGNKNESEADRDVKGKDDVMEFSMEKAIAHDTAVSGDGTESQHSDNNADAKGEVVEVKIKQTPVFEFAIRGVSEQHQDDIEINDENGEKITASEAIGNVVETSELEDQEPHKIIDKGSSDRGEDEMTETRIEETVRDKQTDIEDMNGDDAKSDIKLSSDGSAATQVKVEERKVKEMSDAPYGDDDSASVLSKTSKNNLSRHNSSKQDTDAVNTDKQVEESSTDIKPFHLVQEPEGLNTVHTNGTVSDVPDGAGSDLETKWHKRGPKDLEGKEDKSTKTDSREPDGTEKEDKEHKVNGEQSVAESLTSPLPLEREEVGDLVSKWVNQHQTRGCFQTFVEPLDDMKEMSSLLKSDGHVNGHLEKGEGSQATNMPESDTLDQMSEKKVSALTEGKQETTVEDFVLETREEKTESDVRSKHSNDESALATKDMLEEGQDKEIRDLKLTAETEYAKKDTASIATENRENQPYEQGTVSDRGIDLIAITKTKDDSKPDSESSSESVSHAKTDNSVHSANAQDTTMTKQQLRLEDVMPQSLSRDRLSTFSVEDSHLFGPTTYPRLATAHPEQSY